MDKYLKAIREDVCSICVDSNEKGFCTLAKDENCAVQIYLPEIVELVQSIESTNIEDYKVGLREKICTECKTRNEDGSCDLREDVNCSLDRSFGLIVNSIKRVDLVD